VEPFIGRIFDFMAVVIPKTGVDDARKEAVAAEGVFLRQFATMLDGRRGDDVYEFILWAWSRRTGEA
jgi:hypothetical protein